MARLTEKQVYRKVTQWTFVKRFGKLRLGDTEYDFVGEIEGETDFPYQQIADAVNLPEGKTVAEHRKAWRKLDESFEAVWREYGRV